jgi:hypothetical protein
VTGASGFRAARHKAARAGSTAARTAGAQASRPDRAARRKAARTWRASALPLRSGILRTCAQRREESHCEESSGKKRKARRFSHGERESE